MTNPPDEYKAKPMSKIIQMISWMVGGVIGVYTGIHLLIPILTTWAVWWAGSKLLTDEKKKTLFVLSFNAGHCLWLLLAVVLMGANAFSTVGSDVFIYVIGLVWLLKNTSFGPLYLLGIFQIVSLGFNGYAFAAATFGSLEHKALLAHVILRALALLAIIDLFLTLKKQGREVVKQ